MSGTLFIVTVPQKKYEDELKKDKSSIIVIHDQTNINKEKCKSDIKIHKNTTTASKQSYAKIDSDNIVISKCKSTECLNSSANVPPLVKSNSDNAINITDSGGYLKGSWMELKQILKPKRNKLKINSAGGVDLLSSFHWDTPLETILLEILSRVNVKNSSWNPTSGDNFWQVTFIMESGNLSEELLQVLRTFGIGSKFKSSVCMLPCALFYKSNCEITEKVDAGESRDRLKETAWNKFSSSVRARHNLAQILQGVRSEAALTFDWLFLLIVAAFVSAIGLVENSTVILVASMLISPLMSPITASTLGTAVKDRSLQLMGVAHELFGLFLALVIGFMFGLVICAVDENYGVGDWPTNEILSRCEIRSLWVGVLVAIPSGAAVALAILGEYTSSLVGVAISASLLPPAVNAGLLWAMSLVHLVYNDDETQWNGVIKSPVYSDDQPTELAILGLISLCLTLVNIVSIFLAGVAVYKVKEVCPLERRMMTWWRVNNKDLDNSTQQYNFDTWNSLKYRQWYGTSNQASNNKTPKNNIIENDTITYRKAPQHHDRLLCNNYDLNRETIGRQRDGDESYNKNISQNPAHDNISNTKTESNYEEEINLQNISEIMMNRGFTRHSLNWNKRNENDDSYSNLRFQSLGHVRDTMPEGLPTLEPSSNATVIPNRNGTILLDSKTYNV